MNAQSSSVARDTASELEQIEPGQRDHGRDREQDDDVLAQRQARQRRALRHLLELLTISNGRDRLTMTETSQAQYLRSPSGRR